MRVDHAASYAEIIISTEYRGALNAAFEQSPEDYAAQQSATDQIIAGAFHNRLANSNYAWEIRRQASLAEIKGTDLGPFSDSIRSLGGEATPSTEELSSIEPGSAEVIRTNSKIVALNEFMDEPIDFMESALDTIDDRKRGGGTRSRNIGPENYTTSLKFFADKFQEFPSSHLDKQLITNQVSRAMEGFVAITRRDAPNFIEMTNLYFAIRALPRGSFDPKFTQQILTHSLEHIPEYHESTLNVMLGALAKMDLKEYPTAAASLVDLALRKNKTFERTANMRQALRAVANLPATPAANDTFRTFLEVRNNLEDPLDIDGIDEINERLLYVVQRVIDDPHLSLQAKELAYNCTTLAMHIYGRERVQGNLTEAQLKQRQDTIGRIRNNFTLI
jgi:hypothetical protein